MVWFYCDDCGDTLKKPKVASHFGQCRASGFTCIDCSRPFDRRSVQGHTQCVTEHEKYAQGATKPGGYAAAGFFGEGNAAQPDAPAGVAEGLSFLSSRPPWTCSICKVTCTSRETLLGHAQGAKHKRRAKAGLAAAGEAGANAHPAENQPAAGLAAATAADAREPELKAEAAGAAEVVATEQSAPAKGGSKRSQEGPAAGSDDSGPARAEKPPKWKKLAAAELKRRGGAVKAKKLLEAVISAAAGAHDSQAVLQKLQKSKRFVFEGKLVRLCT